eukprot:TRINITY_DN1346_c0_g1_i2.p2 TRINITY_DN1346_c0_g1~~TRINITY_DN1346_c0_g1_i2.p2  ORF type:complete len:185 (-),score=21.06 TRINITY_DN1346_c0_g1_i2:6-560(-)
MFFLASCLPRMTPSMFFLTTLEGEPQWWLHGNYCEVASVAPYRLVEGRVEFFLAIEPNPFYYSPMGGWVARGSDATLGEAAALEANEETHGHLEERGLLQPLLALLDRSAAGQRRCAVYHPTPKNALFLVEFDPGFDIAAIHECRSRNKCNPELVDDLLASHAKPRTKFWNEGIVPRRAVSSPT